VSTTITNPLDVIKTHIFTSTTARAAGYTPPPPAHGLLRSFHHIRNRGGLLAFMKGWSASYFRVGPQTTLLFVLNEAFRGAAGLDSI